MKKLSIILKYLDVFGTKFTFYSNQKPRLYTKAGGVLSTVSILGCILTFIFFSLDDLNRNTPISTTSYFSEGYKKIKFGKEKIWIPWRIVDYNNNEFLNHTGVLFPIIYYYAGYRDNKTKHFNLTTKILNYKLCSETSMVNKSSAYHLSIPLNEIYCIDMDDLDMGGSWIGDFINYVEFDLYFCENGINYNDNDEKCSTFEDIANFVGKNNSLKIDIYYPIIHYQPTNKTHPLIIIYRQYFYHLSKYSHKIERIYLQQNILTDDLGWVVNKETNHSYWGLNTLKEDSYFNGDEKDLMNEGSNSRAYSLNIYLNPEIIHHKRHYKKLQFIISDFFPIAYIIFIIMKNISKIFKKAESNKKSIELLFERLKEEPFRKKKKLEHLKINNGSNNNLFINKEEKDNDNKVINFFNEPKKDVEINKKLKNSMNSSSFILNQYSKASNNNITSTLNRGTNNIFPLLSNNKLTVKNSSKQSIILNEPIPILNSSMLNNNNKLIQQKKEKEKRIMIREKLFPYKFYFYSVFVKNLDISNKNFFFSAKFSKIYIFLSRLFDITTYLSLQREFNILKKILKDKQLNAIEHYEKINVNSPTFLSELNDCIEKNKFHILAK